MAILCKPQIKVDNIVLEKDVNNPDGTKNILSMWGKTMPIVKINDYVLSPSELKSYECSVQINMLPSFSMEIDDSNYKLRRIFKKLDTCVIFIGYSTWYIKYNGIITTTFSEDGDASISLNGILFNKELYNSVQESYVNMSIQDILLDIANKTKMGLFTINNSDLTNTIDFCINANTRYIEFFNYCVTKYTNNMWCIDPQYFFYVGNIETLRKQKLDQYTLNQDGKTIPKSDIYITTNHLPKYSTDAEKEIENKKIHADFYTIDTNYGQTHYKSSTQYFINNTELKSNNELGISNSSDNCFAGFEKHYFPFYSPRINKQLGGTLIKISLKNIIYEITPFSVVYLEVFLPKCGEEPGKVSEEHSGKKIVIGYRYKFEQKTDDVEFPTITQYLDLI